MFHYCCHECVQGHFLLHLLNGKNITLFLVQQSLARHAGFISGSTHHPTLLLLIFLGMKEVCSSLCNTYQQTRLQTRFSTCFSKGCTTPSLNTNTIKSLRCGCKMLLYAYNANQLTISWSRLSRNQNGHRVYPKQVRTFCRPQRICRQGHMSTTPHRPGVK